MIWPSCFIDDNFVLIQAFLNNNVTVDFRFLLVNQPYYLTAKKQPQPKAPRGCNFETHSRGIRLMHKHIVITELLNI